MKKLLFILGLVALFLSATAQAQWKIYDCSLYPTEVDTAWHESGDSPDDITSIFTVIDDPDIAENKLLMVDENQGAVKEMWLMRWAVDPAVGGTLVFRCKALEATSYDRDFDVYIYNSAVRERLVGRRGADIQLNKAGISAQLDTKEWHIYRMTILADFIEVFVDEDPLSYLGTAGEALTEPENYFRFGDLGDTKVGSLYDWIIWDESGAYPPGTGTPIPEDLLLYGTSDVTAKPASDTPEDFHLSQNFPNPFNPSTEIRYTVTEKSDVRLTIYDLNGKTVRELVNETRQPGTYSARWDGSDSYQNRLPSGVYVYSLEAGAYKGMRKMTLLK
ncbi:hypothetical protein A2V82_08455 [candidate division KSB1 bacterium RBG_16_48_16]|nr:MAG: hypothetical protein A2V82_08455 [candidate division KSB1 bacterium RBG_16_48_16]